MDKYNWDLTKIFNNDKEYSDSIKEVNEITNKIVSFKGKIMDSSNNLLELLELDDRLDYLIEKLYVYTFLEYYSDMSNIEYQSKKESILSLVDKISNLTSFISPELLKSDYNKVLKYIDDNSKLERFRLSLKRAFKYKKYTLSEKEESILSNTHEIMRTAEDAYSNINNVDIRFDNIKDEDNKSVELTQSNYSIFLTSKNRNVRKNAFNKMYKYYKEHINTISSLYIGNVKNNSFISKVRGYDSILQMQLYPDDVSGYLFEKLIKVTNDNLNFLKDFYKYKEGILGYKLHMYDLYVNTSSSINKKIKYEEAIKIVNEALKPLGSDYLKSFNKIISSRSVDVYPRKNKRSGAYQWGVYGIDPYVSLNYEDTIDSMSTLAHEMGHAMHSYYSDKSQEYQYAGYPIFLAEIASTVNEVLLSEYLYNNTNDKNEKKYYLVEFLDKFKATVYRQVMFSEFEDIIHKKYENGESITKDLLCNTYLDLNKKHFSPVVSVDEDIKYEWARIPHFYTSFYVYKYATGFISALLIADKLLNDDSFKDKYIKFLSSGNTKYPLELLKTVGIDLTDEKVLNRAFEIFNEKLCILKEMEE